MTKITEQQFLEMPDRERDAWIDTNIMGYTLEHFGAARWRVGLGGNVPAYSNDYNAMHRVIEKMEDDGFWWHADRIDSGKPCQFWFKKRVNTICPPSGGAEHKDLKLAVSLAAGRAMEKIE